MADFYLQLSQMTDPGKFSKMVQNLSADPKELCRIVQNICVHVFWADHYNLTIPDDRMGELQIRDTSTRLARIMSMSNSPLEQPRKPGQRIVSNCRHFSVTLVSLLRSRGIPARARCGFAAYFVKDQFVDHWVSEYWNESGKRWILVDPQLDELQQKTLHLQFDPLDVPRDQFITGGSAWRSCRTAQADPEKFGIFDMHGLGFVRGNLVRDLAALNNMEMLPWDCWGVILNESLEHPADLKLLDEAAELTYADAPKIDEIRKIYQTNPELRVGSHILSYVNGQMLAVTL